MKKIIVTILFIFIFSMLLGTSTTLATPDLIAVAPDDANVIASADPVTNEVKVSTDGGAIWINLGVPVETGSNPAIAIYDIAISHQTDGTYYIAVAGTDSANVANIWYFNLANTPPTWTETNDLPGYSAPGANSGAFAIAFSPAFPLDRVMVAITAVWDGGSNGDNITFEVFSFSTERWNYVTGFWGYPVMIANDDGITGIESASIVLDPAYLATKDQKRIAFVNLSVAGDAEARLLSGLYRLDDYVVSRVTTAEIKDIAVTDDGAIFLTTATETIYRSTDLGKTWYLRTAPASGQYLIAAAPDNKYLVAIANTATNQVWLSRDSAFTFSNLGRPQQSGGGAANLIRDIAISAETSDGNHYIAVAGEEAGPYANVWYCEIDPVSASAWQETNSFPGFQATSSNSTVGAVAFSPNFPSDKVMVAITEEDDGSTDTDNVSFEIFSVSIETWNIPFGPDYPVTIVSDDGITGLDSASISLAPDYNGADDAFRNVFVGLTVAGDADAVATSGIYRLEDVTLTALKTGAEIDIYSIAFNGRNLVAGEYGSNTVYYCKNPTAPIPVVDTSFKPPSGAGMVVVAWANRLVTAGTSGENSVFAISQNKGKIFHSVDLP